MNRDNATIDNIKQFTDQCFDRDTEKAASIIKGILDARSPRISDISNAVELLGDKILILDKEFSYQALEKLEQKESEKFFLSELFFAELA